MIKVDLKELKKYQQVPKINFYPIKRKDNLVYLVKKLEIGTGEIITDGIYRYDIKIKSLNRIDYGEHTKNPHKYEMFVPADMQSINIIDDQDYLVYSIVKRDDKDKDYQSLKFYTLDFTDYRQELVFSIKFSAYEYFFDGFTILTPKYILADIINAMGENLLDYTKEYLIDIKNTSITEVQDYKLKYSMGMLQISPNEKYVISEEFYMPEEDETLLLTNTEYEIDDEYEMQMFGEQLNQYQNSIKAIEIEKFFEQNDTAKIEFLDLDSIQEEGIIRVIHTSKSYVYYKKTKHQSVLKNSRDFKDKVLFGKEEIFKLNKNNLKIEFFTALEIGVDLFFDQDEAFKVYKDQRKVLVRNVATGLKVAEFTRDINEDVVDFYEKRYLHLVNTVTNKEKLIDSTNGIQLRAEELEVFDGIVFYQ
ncbi:hypothetical protein [Criibacterium bergeronii]|uniref:Uncharacterized protein n=1 Tax=Criibacterium bergeronii TaxID=1871336 RepID=A0A371INY3_9FIRM|nr:hypothetical protein [Criibacterium bergeronii]MBS6062453.1 hypothetical protein [Peptostreptococcaceae bacterium]RDY22202.1 hypothetical protein BBG48_000345 [Criibacterium bergeronii]